MKHKDIQHNGKTYRRFAAFGRDRNQWVCLLYNLADEQDVYPSDSTAISQ